MPEDYQYIERYFEGKFSSSELIEFENRIEKDPLFAEQLAFYVSSMQVARQQASDEKKDRFRQIYTESNAENGKHTSSLVQLWKYISVAAVVTGIIIVLYLFYPSSVSSRVADQYLQERLKVLPVTMDNSENSFKTGVSLYNEGKLQDAMVQFENVVRMDSSNFKAKEYAGIVSLRLRHYDKAFQYFKDLENYPGLYANPGKFYHALTFMKRNLPGDSGEARKLLQEVIANHLDLEKEAKELLEKL